VKVFVEKEKAVDNTEKKVLKNPKPFDGLVFFSVFFR